MLIEQIVVELLRIKEEMHKGYDFVIYMDYKFWAECMSERSKHEMDYTQFFHSNTIHGYPIYKVSHTYHDDDYGIQRHPPYRIVPIERAV